LKFEREDWACFRTVEGLQQKAGVAKDKLRRLVLNNGLDLGGEVDTGKLPDGGYFIEDNGGGIDGTPEEVARLFSIGRPMISTKLARLPVPPLAAETHRFDCAEQIRMVLPVGKGPIAAGQWWHALQLHVAPARPRRYSVGDQSRSSKNLEDAGRASRRVEGDSGPPAEPHAPGR
jgi:hypothetical protein